MQKAARWPCGVSGRGVGSNSIPGASWPMIDYTQMYKRWPQSLFDPNGTSQHPRVGSSSAPTFSQNQEMPMDLVNSSETGEAVFRHNCIVGNPGNK